MLQCSFKSISVYPKRFIKHIVWFIQQKQPVDLFFCWKFRQPFIFSNMGNPYCYQLYKKFFVKNQVSDATKARNKSRKTFFQLLLSIKRKKQEIQGKQERGRLAIMSASNLMWVKVYIVWMKLEKFKRKQSVARGNSMVSPCLLIMLRQDFFDSKDLGLK